MDFKNGLISSYPLDESSGGAADNFGSNDLSDNNTVTSETGLVYDTARTFVSANSEYLSITDGSQSGLDMGTDDWTVEVWVKPASGGNGQLVAKAGFGGGINPTGWFFTIDGSGFFRFAINVNGDGIYISPQDGTKPAADGSTWNHMVATADRSGNSIRYINASTVGSAKDISGANGVDISNTKELRIGARDEAADPNYFNGAIGPVRIWNRALSADDVTALYNSGDGLTDRQLFWTPKTIIF